MPHVTDKSPTPLIELLPRFRQMCAEAGRDADRMDISIGGQQPDADLVKRYRDAGVSRVSASLPSEKADTILPMLDQWAAVIRDGQRLMQRGFETAGVRAADCAARALGVGPVCRRAG